MNFVLQPWQLLLAILAGWSSPLPRRTQPPRLGQSPYQPGRRDRAFHRRSALSAAPRRRLALLLPTRRLAPFLHPGIAEPPGDRSKRKGRVAACRGRTKPLRQVPRSTASAQIIHLRHTQIRFFHRDSLRSRFLTIRAFDAARCSFPFLRPIHSFALPGHTSLAPRQPLVFSDRLRRQEQEMSRTLLMHPLLS